MSEADIREVIEMRNGRGVVFWMAGVVALAAVMALAGDLDPPPGPIASTMLRLDEIEPRTPIGSLPGDASTLHIISEPGSYFLSGPLLAEQGKSGIRVAANNVTIDLNGFMLESQDMAHDAIMLADITGLVVQNGGFRGWHYSIVGLASFSRFEDLTAPAAGEGFRVHGTHNVFEMVSVSAIGEVCIETGGFARITNCATNGAFTGIAAEANSIIEDCIVKNAARGIIVGGAPGGAIVRGNTIESPIVNGHMQSGIIALDGARIERNRIAGAAECAISVTQHSVVLENHCLRSGVGIRCGAIGGPDFLTSNRIESNQLADNGIGIEILSAGDVVARNTIIGGATGIIDSGQSLVGPVVADLSIAGPWANVVTRTTTIMHGGSRPRAEASSASSDR